MATYVTTNPMGANNTQNNILIQNFIMVENFNEIDTLLRGYTSTVDLPEIDDTIQCVSIWNKDPQWDERQVPNTDPVVMDTFTLYVKYGTLTNRDTMYENTDLKFTIIGRIDGANPCKLKKIFHDLTRFRAQQLNIDHGAGTNIAAINPTDQKTLDNRIIFVRKSNIKDLFTIGTLTAAGTDFNWVDSLKNFLKTDEFETRQCISNFFRGFAPIIDIPNAVNNNNIRESLGLGDMEDIVSNNKLFGFKEFINNTRQLSGIGTGFNYVLNNITNILVSKTSADGTNNTISTAFTTNDVKQHWLGNIRPRGVMRVMRNPELNEISFRRYIREKSNTLNTRDLTNIERYIMIVLTITATNGLNPTPPVAVEEPCRIIRVTNQ